MSEINLSIRDMSKGLRVGLDDINEPAGSFRLMRNARITDRGGIAKRQGVSVIGDYDSSGESVRGLFRYQKADGSDILVKALETTHKYLDTTWVSFETGLTASDHDYAPHVVNTADDDYLYFSSKENGYRRWKGWHDRTTSVLAGGETEIPVTSVLKADVYHSGTAASVSMTTVNVTGTPWAANQWNGFYVRITSGAQSGRISPVSATTTGQITFAAIAGLSGTPTFEIRQIDVPASGTVLVGGTSVAYTSVTNDDSLTVASAPAAASGSAVVLVPTAYPGAPKGQAMDVWLTKILVGNIKSAMSKDGLGNDIATSVSRAVYVSNAGDGTDFSFSAPRSANEGDIIELAYGGGSVLDVAAQEDAFYVGTQNYIEADGYTQVQDASGNTDVLQRRPLKPGIGLAGRFVKGKDDLYFFTPAGEFTSIGRVANVDSTPQSLDIGYPIRRLLDGRVNTHADGIEWDNRLYMAHRLDSGSAHNDRVLVYNRGTKSFEGDWILPASFFAVWNGKPCFGSSNGANVMQMHDGEADVWDGVDYPISAEVKSNWINVTPSGMEDQSLTGFHVSGYIRGNSAATYYLYADYSDTPVLSVTLTGTDDQVFSVTVRGSLGEVPLGEEPLASVDEADEDGLRRFRFSAWFPDQYCQAVSWGWKSSGTNEYVETNQVGYTISADPLSVAAGLIKT
jgi:hypothetical protein